MKHIVLPLAILLLFTSCEKNINFNLKNVDDVLVVDAQVENGQAPTVFLTKGWL